MGSTADEIIQRNTDYNRHSTEMGSSTHVTFQNAHNNGTEDAESDEEYMESDGEDDVEVDDDESFEEESLSHPPYDPIPTENYGEPDYVEPNVISLCTSDEN